MKRLLFLYIIMLLLVGCTKNKEDDYMFKLEGNPSTGFEWTCKDYNNLVSISYKIESLDKKGILTGSPVIYKFNLVGLKKGETTIICTYQRPWEEEYGDKFVEYPIKVDENLNVILT